MARYILDMTKPDQQSFIELVNNDNAATIGEPLTLEGVNLVNERPVLEAEGIPRQFAVTVENKAYVKDKTELFFNKVKLEDVVTMSAEAGDFNWYDPDTWDEATSPAQAVTAFKAAAVRAGVGADVVLHDIAAVREYDNELNRYYLVIATKSMVFHTGAKFQMPKHFSETVTVTELNGFIYEPIKPEDVVA